MSSKKYDANIGTTRQASAIQHAARLVFMSDLIFPFIVMPVSGLLFLFFLADVRQL